MNDVRLIWDGARADFGLALGTILGAQAAAFSGSGQGVHAGRFKDG